MPERLGKYSLVKLLATGGMAEIWLARQRGVGGFEKLVVIKRILPHLSKNSRFVQMFLDEARLAAQLSHPNIVQIYELGRANDRYFIAMEFIHGENLRTISRAAEKAARCLNHDSSAKVISQACEGLYYAHNKKDLTGKPLGLVHRDISPQNILLSFDGQTKIVDFGIAKAATQCEETRTGMLKGKFSYMSPEQCRGEKLDARSDIFALGIVLWELATGARLFKQSSELMILKAICDEPTMPPTEVKRDIPAELEAIILKALAKDRNERFRDCHEMHLALESYLRARTVRINSFTLADEMYSLFAKKLSAWNKVLENLQQEEEDLDSRVYSDLSSLLRDGTPSSQRKDPSDVASSEHIDAPADSCEATPTATSSLPASMALSHRGPSGSWRSRLPGRAWVFLAALLVTTGALTIFALTNGDWGRSDSRLEKTEQEERTGTLVIESEPLRADVFIDGHRRGATPLTLAGIPVNQISNVRVEAEGLAPWIMDVTLEAPQDRRVLTALLEPGSETQPAVLEVRTEPEGARIYIDEIEVKGLTPLTIDVEPNLLGKSVRLEREGFEPVARSLDLEPGSKARWDLLLRKAATEEEVATKAPSTRPPHRTGQSGSRTRQSAKGLLSVNARPWCNVSIEGQELGQTPVVRAEVPAGRRQLLCANPQIGTKRVVTVNVPPGGHARKNITFEMGNLDVRVRPWAEVLVDGRSLGTTPFQPQPIPVGTYRVVLQNPSLGFRKEYQVSIKPNETHTIRENLLQ